MSTYPKQLADTEEGFERWQLYDKEVVARVHRKTDCAPPCPLHFPSEHVMGDFPLHWREDRGIFERMCPHGIGHPDPDTLEYIAGVDGSDRAAAESVHGCDGCCHRPPVLLGDLDGFEMSEKEMENVLTAALLGGGEDGCDEDCLIRVASNFAADVKMAALTATINDLVQLGEVVLLEDEDDPKGWKVKIRTK